MADIYHDFTIDSPTIKVFAAVSTPEGLDKWWTRTSGLNPISGEYYLDFGPGYSWRALLTNSEAGKHFELRMTVADADWLGSRVGFSLSAISPGCTKVRFYHTGWPAANEHCRKSSFCWAMYLRILKRWLEFGEQVAYEKRLSV